MNRVAVLIAVMICRVTQSSAKLRNDVSLSERKSRTAFQRPISPSWMRSSDFTAGEEVRARLHAHEAGVAADELLACTLVAVSARADELEIPSSRFVFCAVRTAVCVRAAIGAAISLSSPCQRVALSRSCLRREVSTLKLRRNDSRVRPELQGHLQICKKLVLLAAPEAARAQHASHRPRGHQGVTASARRGARGSRS